MNKQLLIIDAQNDFCHPQGALYVPGAQEDCLRIAKFIKRSIDMLDDIRVTLDSHQPVHIAHPICWVDAKGNHPQPFTLIREEDVVGKTPKWRAFNPAWQEHQVNYVQTLKRNGRYDLTIWPPHCLIGSQGHALLPEISEALAVWQREFALVDFVTKGSNPFTEHYSVVKADVVDPADHTTALNTGFIERLETADEIFVTGEALSHCFANSVKDIVSEFGEEHIQKLILLTDATSSVPGFEAVGEAFLKEMTSKGMKTAKTTDF